jgi:hypothetical protein
MNWQENVKDQLAQGSCWWLASVGGRRTGATADGSRHVCVCSGRSAGELADERVGGLA